MASYMCDGSKCGFTGSEKEVDDHVREAVCDGWGVMTVGGRAWVGFQKGIHPMETLTELVAEQYTGYVLQQNGIET